MKTVTGERAPEVGRRHQCPEGKEEENAGKKGGRLFGAIAVV